MITNRQSWENKRETGPFVLFLGYLGLDLPRRTVVHSAVLGYLGLNLPRGTVCGLPVGMISARSYFPLSQTNRDSLRVGLMRELEQSEHRVLASPSRQGVGLEVHEKTRHQQLAYSRGAGREHSSAGTGRAPPGLRRPCG